MSDEPVVQQRSIETQQTIIAATLEAIDELGYHRASTTEIVKRAGMSRGAMLHHFPTKVELLSAAFKQLHDEVAADVARLIAQAQADGREWVDLLDEIMTRYFSGRSWDVFLEMMVAARTDEALWNELVPTVMKYYLDVDQVWHQYFAADDGDGEMSILLNLSMCVLRGMAVQKLLRDDPTYYETIIRQLKTLIQLFLETRKEGEPHV